MASAHDAAALREPLLLQRQALFVVALAVAVYSIAVFGAYVYDDVSLVLRNPAMQRGDWVELLTQPLHAAETSFWRPLTLMTLFVGDRLAGAAGVHTIALLVHALNAVAALALARRFLPPHAAFCASVLFVVHPVQVEAVAWCSAINDLLWVGLTLWATLAALRWRDRAAPGLPWATIALVFAALLAKETAIAGPLVVCAALLFVPAFGAVEGSSAEHGDVSDAGRTVADRATLGCWPRLVAGLAIAVGVYAALRLAVQASAEPISSYAGAATPGALLATPRLVAHHFGLLLAPVELTPLRGLPALASLNFVLGVTLAAVLLLAVALRRPRAGHAAKFGAALLLLPLLPPLLRLDAIGLHPVNDRYLYASVLGLGLFALSWLRSDSMWPKVVVWPVLALLAVLSVLQIAAWRSPRALADHVVAVDPEEADALLMAADQALVRAQTEADSKQWAQARDLYSQAAEAAKVVPPNPERRARSAALLGLAWCMLLDQSNKKATRAEILAAFEAAIEAGPHNAAAWDGLGVARARLGMPTEARAAFQRAIDVDADHVEAWFNLGRLHFLSRRPSEARRCLLEVLERSPRHAEALRLLNRLGG